MNNLTDLETFKGAVYLLYRSAAKLNLHISRAHNPTCVDDLLDDVEKNLRLSQVCLENLRLK